MPPFHMLCRLLQLNSMSANEELPDDQVRQLSHDLERAYAALHSMKLGRDDGQCRQRHGDGLLDIVRTTTPAHRRRC